MNSSNSKRLCNLYAGFQQGNDGFLGPKDESELRGYINSLPEAGLELYGIQASEIDDLFLSERDGKPFRIKYGVRGSQHSNDAVVFEESGSEGVRIVGFTGMTEKEVSTDAEYDQLWTAKASPKRRQRRGAPATRDASIEDEFDLE